MRYTRLVHKTLLSFLFAFLLLASVLLSGCGSDNVEPTAPPPLAPTTAPIPAPTVVSTINASTAATSNVSPTRAATTVANAVGPNTCPFTGLPLNQIDLAARRPLLIKLGNSPPERPQSGLDKADIVVEHLTEGAITRFSAVFYCSDAAAIGPIRSARLIDLELVPMFGAIFAHVGGSEPVRQMIAASGIGQADFDDYGRAPIFREISERKRPFNRYTGTPEMYALAAKQNLITGAPLTAMRFEPMQPAGGVPAATITVPYRKNLSDAEFTYDAMRGAYVRGTAASPQLDAVSNQALTASNVLVLYAPHETTNIVEDSLGSRSIQITLTGTGKATLLREGQAFDLTWSRTDPNSFFQFTTAKGNPIGFKPGNIWIEVVPTEMQVAIE